MDNLNLDDDAISKRMYPDLKSRAQLDAEAAKRGERPGNKEHGWQAEIPVQAVKHTTSDRVIALEKRATSPTALTDGRGALNPREREKLRTAQRMAAPYRADVHGTKQEDRELGDSWYCGNQD